MYRSYFLMQDFMGFLHLGWESATYEDDASAKSLADLSPLWGAVAQSVDLSRPGLPTVQRVLGWHPLHVAAMAGSIELVEPSCSARTSLLRASVMLTQRVNTPAAIKPTFARRPSFG